MEVHLTPTQESKLKELVASTGRGAEELVLEALDKMLVHDIWFTSQVQTGLEQLDRGEFVEHEEVARRIEKLFRS